MKEQKKNEVKVYFKVVGNKAVCEFERYQRLSWAGKRMITEFLKRELQGLGFFVRNIILGKLEDYGYKRDEFFSFNVELPKAFIRETRRQTGFRLADIAK